MADFRTYPYNSRSEYWQLAPAPAAVVSRYLTNRGIKHKKSAPRERMLELWGRVLTERVIYENCSYEELEKFISDRGLGLPDT